uniref:NAD(P)-binding protein n=1 Tax=Globodera pallida TaxID=36090 RepID=A0A183CEJ3_GLOPA
MDNYQKQRFQGKVVIITGSSAGIGQTAAIEFAKEGQIEDEKTAQKIVAESLNKFGRIDVLINNAACVAKPGNEDPLDIANLDHIYSVNLRSIVVLTKLAMPHLEKSGGNVLNISSCASQRFMSARVRPFYGIMKAALDHWTRIMALNCGEKGVRVNSINPGPIDDTLIAERDGQRGPVEQKFADKTVLKRLGLPTEIAPAMKLLCSDDASFITGVCLLIDGGVSLCA